MASGIPPKKKAEIAPETDAQPTYRMAMLPFATYANPDGTESLGLALPGMIHEPLAALGRLAANSVDENGKIAIPNPENPQNQQDVLTGLLSLYGGNALNPAAAIPKGGLAAGALREAAESAPQRMYHGTTADFSTFKPSESGSFGPGVYFSSSPEYASQFAFQQNGSRVFPVDVQGPLASREDYFSLLHANGRDEAKTLKMLEDQGYTGIITSGERPSQNVTSVFKPGSVRSATTGEILYSDQLPSPAGALATGQDTSNSDTNGDGSMIAPPQVGMLSGLSGTTLANPNPNAPQMSLPAGLLSGMGLTGAAPQTPPAAAPGAAPRNAITDGLIQGDKDAIAVMPNMDDFQFSAPQRAPVDLSRLVAIAQARALGSRAQ